MSSEPKVSILISTYNRLPQLRQALDTILGQSYDNYEIVIINDASNDGTRNYLDNLRIPSDMLVIHNEKNLGLQKSLNKAIAASKGRFIARIDDDDRWIDSHKIEKQVQFLNNNPEYGLVGTNYLIGGKKVFNPESDKDIRRQMLFRCPFRHSTVVFDRHLYEKVGAYNEDLPYSEDWELWMKMGKHSKMANLQFFSTAISEEDTATKKYFTRQIPINISIVRQNMHYYPGKIRALIYHHFVRLFFKIIPLNGLIHNCFKRIFLWVFKMKQ
jgi:glycosyltransferase involved in cell wall biosynthesis